MCSGRTSDIDVCTIDEHNYITLTLLDDCDGVKQHIDSIIGYAFFNSRVHLKYFQEMRK